MVRNISKIVKTQLVGAAVGTFLGAVGGFSDLALSPRMQAANTATYESGTPVKDNTGFSDLESRLVPVTNSQTSIPKKITAPIYTDKEVPANHCARYVRLAGKELFGETYNATDAWNLRSVERVVAEVGDDWENNVRNMAKNGKLQQGMSIGVYNPTSKYNRSGRKYTHVALYLGQNDKGEPIFAEKLGKSTRTSTTLNDIKARGMRIVEILDSK